MRISPKSRDIWLHRLTEKRTRAKHVSHEILLTNVKNNKNRQGSRPCLGKRPLRKLKYKMKTIKFILLTVFFV